MKKTLLLTLGMVLLVACGGSDPTTGPSEPVLNTTAHSEVDGTWLDGPSVSAINWRLVDLRFYGALRISYNMTWTDNDPSRAINITYYLTFYDASGFHTVRFKERLRQDALTKVELDVPEIDWDLWRQECTSDAHNTARAVKAD